MAVVLSLVSLAACSGGEEPSASADASALADTVMAGQQGLENGGAAPLPTLPGEGAPRQYRLRLVNLLEREAFVFASAGAGRVAVDTVPGADSTLVDLRLRADHVTLEARDPSGSVVKSEELELDPSAINRWEIARMGPSRVALGRRARPLVTAEPGDYPRSR
jgi:hypothetical protein